MKKFSILLSLLLSISLVFALTSCGGTSSDTSSDTNSETDTGVGDANTPADTGDSNTNSPTDTENPENDNTGTQQPPVDTNEPVNPPSTNEPETPPTTDEPDVDPDEPTVDPVVPPVEENMTMQEFLAHNDGKTAKDFALDVIDDMSKYDAMKGIYYSLVGDEGKITKVNVAFIVDGEGTQRKLMQAEINIVGGVGMQDIVDGNVDDFIAAIETTGTLLTFDAKEEANKGSNSTIQTQIEETIDKAIGEDAETVQEYQMEEFSATVADWAVANAEQIKTHMNSNYLAAFGKKAMGVRFDSNKVADIQWIFEGENKIENVKMILTYNSTSSVSYKSVVSANLTTPIEMEDILKSSTAINTSNLTEEYQFDYNSTIQGTRDDLVNALFKAVGVNETNGIRYFRDLGQSAMIDGLGMAHGFTVVEIGGDEIKEYTVYVNMANDDAGYINKLKNSAEFKITDSKMVDIIGASVEYVAQAEN